MHQPELTQQINTLLNEKNIDRGGEDEGFFSRFMANASTMASLYHTLYGQHYKAGPCFASLLETVTNAHLLRGDAIREKDEQKLRRGIWFLSQELAGMSLYVDRFCGSLSALPDKLPYLEELGVNLVHLMPIFESPAGESDGGYAVSHFRKVDPRFGRLEDLLKLREHLHSRQMYLMLDIVLNHTSHRHEWAERAKEGEKEYQDYFYLYPNRQLPDLYEQSMPEIFPESAPGSFTFIPEIGKWAMTVFHNYQWDLNYTNPEVFVKMLDTILFYANLGVDILRIDAPAFIWKKPGTSCQNLPEAHQLLQLIKQCVQVAAPGMALLGEAIVAPGEIMKYFGTGLYTAKECDFAYNATHMALQWDALATGDTKVMLSAQQPLLQKPYGTSWITYTRCHDDIGLGYDDYMIEQAGYDPYQHRKFLKEYYSGTLDYSPARGALFSVNPKTNDARISGSLASLCGLEKALETQDGTAITLAIQKILLMQAHSFFLGGLPILFYGDEIGHTNDYSYLQDPGKSYDNRWMHRPIVDWKRYARIHQPGTVEQQVFTGTQKLLRIRKQLKAIADHKNLVWLTPHNIHVAGYLRSFETQRCYGIFNFSKDTAYLTWYAFKENGVSPARLLDHWSGKEYVVGADSEYLIVAPYGFHLFEEQA